MPIDRYKTFAGLSEEDVRKLLPEALVAEYLHHGQEPTAQDDPRHIAGYDENDNRLPADQVANAARKVYQRPLRDYAYLFAELTRQKTVLMARVDAVREDNAKLEAAIASAKKLTTFREEEIKLMKADLAGMKADRKAIEEHLRLVNQQLENARKLISEFLATNTKLAEDLARREAELVQMINAVAPAPATAVSLP
jgi:chromosome segregation ATPase